MEFLHTLTDSFEAEQAARKMGEELMSDEALQKVSTQELGRKRKKRIKGSNPSRTKQSGSEDLWFRDGTRRPSALAAVNTRKT